MEYVFLLALEIDSWRLCSLTTESNIYKRLTLNIWKERLTEWHRKLNLPGIFPETFHCDQLFIRVSIMQKVFRLFILLIENQFGYESVQRTKLCLHWIEEKNHKGVLLNINSLPFQILWYFFENSLSRIKRAEYFNKHMPIFRAIVNFVYVIFILANFKCFFIDLIS